MILMREWERDKDREIDEAIPMKDLKMLMMRKRERESDREREKVEAILLEDVSIEEGDFSFVLRVMCFIIKFLPKNLKFK